MVTGISSSNARGSDGQRITRTTITFDGGTQDAIGDWNGTGAAATVFTLTGSVLVKIYAVCTESLVFDTNASIEVGISGNTAVLIAQTDMTGDDPLVAQEIWHDNSPDAEMELSTVATEYVLTDSTDIILTVGTANVTAGVIAFAAVWTPLSPDGDIA